MSWLFCNNQINHTEQIILGYELTVKYSECSVMMYSDFGLFRQNRPYLVLRLSLRLEKRSRRTVTSLADFSISGKIALEIFVTIFNLVKGANLAMRLEHSISKNAEGGLISDKR